MAFIISNKPLCGYLGTVRKGFLELGFWVWGKISCVYPNLVILHYFPELLQIVFFGKNKATLKNTKNKCKPMHTGRCDLESASMLTVEVDGFSVQHWDKQSTLLSFRLQHFGLVYLVTLASLLSISYMEGGDLLMFLASLAARWPYTVILINIFAKI